MALQRIHLLITLIATALLNVSALSQENGNRVRRLEILYGTPANPKLLAPLEAFRNELKAKHWVEDRNLKVTVRYGDSNASKVKRLVKEIHSKKPDVIFVIAGHAALQMKRVISDIPIVFLYVSDPVQVGLIDSLARPGRNFTGVGTWDTSATQKLIELLVTVAPNIRNVATIHAPINSSRSGYAKIIRSSAEKLGFSYVPLLARNTSELDRVLSQIARTPNTGLVLLPDPVTLGNQAKIINFTLKNRIPVIAWNLGFSESGGLLSYGIAPETLYRNAAKLVDKILRGTPVSTLPVQLPDRYEFVVNLKAFRAMRLEPSPSIMVRASKVIE